MSNPIRDDEDSAELALSVQEKHTLQREHRQRVDNAEVQVARAMPTRHPGNG